VLTEHGSHITTVALPVAKICQKEVFHPEAGADAAFGGLVTLAMS